MNEPQLIPVSVANTIAAQFRALFEGTWEAWEICGATRRNRPAPKVVHVVRSKLQLDQSAASTSYINRVVHRAAQLVEEKSIEHLGGNDYGGRYVHHGRVHELVIAKVATWGTLLAKHTGPPTFWGMLAWRLQKNRRLWLAEDGAVTRPDTLLKETVNVHCEPEFFRLARTEWVSPQHRREIRRTNWPRGMLRAYVGQAE